MRFNKKVYALSYDKKLSSEGYPGELFLHLVNLIQGKTILEIGAGSGLVTIPLLKEGYHVTALDPSMAMLSILKKKLKPEYNCSIRNESWPSSDTCTYDTIISVHSLYPMKDIETAIFSMIQKSPNVLIAVRQDTGNHTISSLLRERLNIQKKAVKLNRDIETFLINNNVQYQVKEVIEKRKVTFKDFDKESNYYLKHLNMQEITDIKENLRQIIEYDDNKHEYTFSSILKDNIYHIINK